MVKADLNAIKENEQLKDFESTKQKLKASMVYFMKYKQSHENLLMFVMDV